MPLSAQERVELRKRCTHEVGGFAEPSAAQLFHEMGAWCESHGVEHDVYGGGSLIADFESKIATMLGKQNAVFMPSGVMAQLIALRIWTEARALMRFGMHSSSHLQVHEEQAYASLFGLHGVLLGHPHRVIVADDLARVGQDLACLIIELPMRELGGILPSWSELEGLKEQARASGVKLHMDGARLWESRAFYGRSYAEIADGFDSVYVSMYKGVGAIAGAVLAGDQIFCDTARLWRRRMGGTLVHQSPMIVSAAMQLDRRLSALDACYARTLEFAASVADVSGIRVQPAVPQTNMVHLFFGAPVEDVLRARDRVATEEGYWLLGNARAADVPGWCRTELTLGDRMLALDVPRVRTLFDQLMVYARISAGE